MRQQLWTQSTAEVQRWPSARRLLSVCIPFTGKSDLLEAVSTREPPGAFLPFSGQACASAGAACLMAMKTLVVSFGSVPDSSAHLNALTRMISMYSSSEISAAKRVNRLSASIPVFSLALPRTWEIPALAKKKSRWPSSLIAFATRDLITSADAASPLTAVNCLSAASDKAVICTHLCTREVFLQLLGKRFQVGIVEVEHVKSLHTLSRHDFRSRRLVLVSLR